MKLSRKIVLAGGAVLGLIPIVLGIVAVATNSWINIKSNNAAVPIDTTYGLFRCKGVRCSAIPDFPIAHVQGLEIAGVVAIGVGVIIAVLLNIFTKSRWIPLSALIFLFAGPTLILIGLLLYAKYVFEDLSKTPSPVPVAVNLGYSLILIVVACIVGYLTAIYFAFAAGFGRHHHRIVQPHIPPVVFVERSEQF